MFSWCPRWLSSDGLRVVNPLTEEQVFDVYQDMLQQLRQIHTETPPEPHEMSDPLLPPRVDRDRASDEAQDQRSMILTAF